MSLCSTLVSDSDEYVGRGVLMGVMQETLCHDYIL